MVAVLSNLEISTRVTKSLFSQTQDSMMEAWWHEERVWPNLFPIDFGIWAAEAKVRSSLKSWMIHIFENNFTSLQTPFNSPLAHFHTSASRAEVFFEITYPRLVFQSHTCTWLTAAATTSLLYTAQLTGFPESMGSAFPSNLVPFPTVPTHGKPHPNIFWSTRPFQNTSTVIKAALAKMKIQRWQLVL